MGLLVWGVVCLMAATGLIVWVFRSEAEKAAVGEVKDSDFKDDEPGDYLG